MNRKTCNFELHIEINLDYDKAKEPMKKLDERKKAWQKITPAAQVERLKVRQLINFLVSFRYWSIARSLGVKRICCRAYLEC